MTTATVTGVAKDTSGAVMPSVTITVKNVDTGAARTATTNQRGQYIVPNLPPGNYEAEATIPGFQTAKRTGIALTVGSETVVDLELSVGQTTQIVEVSGELPIVDTTTSTMSGLVDERRIRDLPLNGRSFETLALLQVGVTQYNFVQSTASRGRGTQFSVSGSRPTQNAFLLDGMDITESGGATPGSAAGVNLGVEAIREFQILTGTFPAEFGRSPGGIINAVTRSGSNALHGSAYEFLRNSVFDAKNFFDDPSKPIPAFKRNQFGAALGGPIRKDRAFFFGNYEALRARTGLSLQAVVPSRAARSGNLPGNPVTVSPVIRPYLESVYPLPNGEELTGGGAILRSSPTGKTRDDYSMERVDVRLSENTSLFVRYVFEDATLNIPNLVPVTAALTESRRNQAAVGLDHIFSASVLNSFRAGFDRHADLEDDQPLVEIPASLSFVRGERMGAISIGGGGISLGASSSGVFGFSPVGSSRFTPRRYIQDIFEFSDTLNYTTGAHAFKMGANVKRIRNNSSLASDQRGTFTFPSLSAFLTGVPNQYQGIAIQGYPKGYRQFNVGFFLQDDYRVRPSLTLNLGLRWEFATAPTEVNEKLSNIVNLYTDTQATVGVGVNPKKKNIEPRIGFAWSPTASKKTALRGGFSIYHEHAFPIVYHNYLGSLPPFHQGLVVQNPAFPDPLAGGTVRADPPGGSPREINFHSPMKLQYNFNMQQEILPATSLTIGYVGSQNRWLPLSQQINERTPSPLPDGTTFYPLNAPNRNPNLGGLLYASRSGSGSYNGMVVAINRQSRGRLGYQISYTWGKSLDNASSINSSEATNSRGEVMNIFDIKRDKGYSSFDVRHSFVANYNISLTAASWRGPAGHLLNDWRVEGIVSASSGTAMNILTGFNRARSHRSATAGADRPDLVPGRSSSPVLGDPALYYDPASFSLPAAGFFGNLGRNTLIGPGLFNLDFSVAKEFGLTERYRLAFRSEFFNFSNTPHFGIPGQLVFQTNGSLQPNAGKILQTTGTSRQIQFSMKLTF